MLCYLCAVSESVVSRSLALGAPTPPPHSPYSPLPLDLLACSQRLLIDKEGNKMEDGKLGKACLPELCCPGDRADGHVLQPLTIKTEQAKRTCNTCLTNSPKKVVQAEGGCSRTNPVTWLGVGQNVHVQVKREPHHMHVSELVAVKLEQASPGTKPDQPMPAIPASLNNGSIPVGIAVARQRVGDAGLLAALSQKDNQRLHDIDKILPEPRDPGWRGPRECSPITGAAPLVQAVTILSSFYLGLTGGHLASDKPFSSARVILGDQKLGGVTSRRRVTIRYECERDGARLECNGQTTPR
ncbi:hypothetical protein RR48_11669 [Papilio machaon]|uniref:Uncharacterized protein n=1 Tax=Papilio machaon TaxID=76193 RepID=A0A194R3N0_PAPMA|nr:hypothetical protein RR48_11669 [Papilio machaon]